MSGSFLSVFWQLPELLLTGFFAWLLLYKSPLIRVWWRLVGPILEPLGFRVVVMDMRFGLHSIRYYGRDAR